jgi:hypothetical protein
MDRRSFLRGLCGSPVAIAGIALGGAAVAKPNHATTLEVKVEVDKDGEWKAFEAHMENYRRTVLAPLARHRIA